MRRLLPFLLRSLSLSLHFDVFCLLNALREPSVYWLPEIHPSFHQPPASIVSTKPVTWWFNRGFLGVISLLSLSVSVAAVSAQEHGEWDQKQTASLITMKGKYWSLIVCFFSSSPASVCSIFHIRIYIHLNSDINFRFRLNSRFKCKMTIFWLMQNSILCTLN